MTNTPARFDAVIFDLLTALIDSWSVWKRVAGDDALGQRWREESLRRVTSTGVYRSYEDIVREATEAMGLPAARAEELLASWPTLQPYPEVPGILQELRDRRLGVVTNCSQRLAEAAAGITGGRFEEIVSAERAGWYKIEPQAYRAGLDALGLTADRVLFVAGSPHDLVGAGRVGMKVFWANRRGLPVPEGAPAPIVNAPDISSLPGLLAG